MIKLNTTYRFSADKNALPVNPEWIEKYCTLPSRIYYFPTEFQTHTPMTVIPTFGFAWETDLGFYDNKIYTAEEWLQVDHTLPGLPQRIILTQVWDDYGNDGHYHWVNVGLKFLLLSDFMKCYEGYQNHRHGQFDLYNLISSFDPHPVEDID